MILIVGAGISGCVLAERYASAGKKVLVIEKRSHIGGNCFDYTNKYGIRVSKYGAHIFHTNDSMVWEYVNQFSDWHPYEHRVLSRVNNLLVPIPVNISTVNMLFNLQITSKKEMENWLKNEVVSIQNPKNSEESSLSRVGPRLYELLFKNYTKKQWDLWPNQLDASVLNRIPVRTNFDSRYFSDKYQYLPRNGYTALFKKMLASPNITVKLHTDYFESEYKDLLFEKVYFTGPIDRYFSHKYSKLQYRSINFKFATYKKKFYQENSVINYPNTEAFTRIVEYKHFDLSNNSPYTTISKEYSSWEGEPYYPVPSERNRKIYQKYQGEERNLKSKNIFFVGRLANYKYFNMDQAFRNALDLYKTNNQKK